MKTRQDEPLRYVELARQGARIERSFAGDDLPRWAQHVEGEWHVQATVQFYCDAQGHSWVDGEFHVRAGLRCTRCSVVVGHAFTGRLTICIVTDEAHAGELGGSCDVLVAGGDSVLVADIVEDELLLTLPEQLCTTEKCERRLPLSYPAIGAVQLEQAEQWPHKNPFDVLAALKQRH